jgi:hypothetical protein
MIKSDLKTGMYVVTKNTLIWLVVVIDNEPYLCYPTGWMPIENFPNINKNNDNYDIIEVYEGIIDNIGSMLQYDIYQKFIQTKNLKNINKIWSTTVKETIKIGENTYDKQEFEDAVKNLKPIK